MQKKVCYTVEKQGIGGFFVAATNFSFRSAFNGFNRSDVVEYIERVSLENEKAQRQLRDENTRLQTELDETKAALSDTLARLMEAEAAAKEPSPAAAQAVSPEEEMPITEAMLDEASVGSPQASEIAELELAAYRRAEAAERAAHRRAAKIYDQVCVSFAETTQQLADSDNDLRNLGETLQQNLQALSQAIAALQCTFDALKERLGAIGASIPAQD